MPVTLLRSIRRDCTSRWQLQSHNQNAKSHRYIGKYTLGIKPLRSSVKNFCRSSLGPLGRGGWRVVGGVRGRGDGDARRDPL